MKRWNHLEQILSDRKLGQTLDKFNRSQYQRSFVPSNDVRNWYDSDQMSGIRALMPLLPVTNDHFTQDQYGSSTFIASAATSKQATTRVSALFNFIFTMINVFQAYRHFNLIVIRYSKLDHFKQ